MENCNIPEIFGSMVFNDSVMRDRLPRDIYRSLRKTIDIGTALDITVANAVASAMKDWAIEKGATHYTHWFQPMNGVTAEKHDSFITPDGGGRVLMQFSGSELIKGEPDASSLPSGGLRATFEARGYTAWDPTSYAFIKEKTLCIPTAFCSYGGEVLDKKTPLLRSMEFLDRCAVRFLRAIGEKDVTRVISTVGAEQEYFLVDKELYKKRLDLFVTGHTLFGNRSAKGQELDDHYFGTIKPRVSRFMEELDEELWKLGICAKTEHNETAPAQHELAPVFTTVNIATDQNQLTMEIMKRVADKHGMICLLHEKPFAGINGSGKHNNWSLCTSDGINLLNPGKKLHENLQFLLFVCAMIRGVDNYQDLLRVSVAGAGNDHRLGGGEAPPAIISIFLGNDITDVLDAIESHIAPSPLKSHELATGISVLPDFTKDATDRNRTSPFAFTGTKFEFRMPGSSQSISEPNVILNTIVADSLSHFANVIEGTPEEELREKMTNLIAHTYHKHKRIVFNGNNYTKEWEEEAKARGLFNLRTTPDAVPALVSEKNIALFKRYGIYTETELYSRCEIELDNYAKQIKIDASTMCEMVRREIIPASVSYLRDLLDVAVKEEKLGFGVQSASKKTATELSVLYSELYNKTEELENCIPVINSFDKSADSANYCRDTVNPKMAEVRKLADMLESKTAKKYLTYPTYAELLFSI